MLSVKLGITGAILNVIPYIGGIGAVELSITIAFVTKSLLSAIPVSAMYTVSL